MKKFFTTFMFIAAAAMAFSSCNKVELQGQEPNDEFVTSTIFHITASPVDTKTVFGDKAGNAYPTKWTKNKQVRFAVVHDTNKAVDVTPDFEGDGTSANFEPEFTDAPESGTIYAFSPVGDFTTTPKVAGFTSFTKADDSNAIYVTIPSAQTPLADSVDESAQAMAASQTYTDVDDPINMRFHHIVAYGKMAISNFTGTIKSVELQFPVEVAGLSCKYVYGTGVIASGLDSKTITLDATNVTNNTFWFALAPTAGNTGEMKIIVTDNNDDTYTKTIDLTAKALPFNVGKVSSFTANFSGIEKQTNYVTLPWNWAGGTSSDFLAVPGVTASGLGSDYAASNAPYRVKFDTTGDNFVIKTDSSIGAISIGIKMLGGSNQSSIDVSGSADGNNYSDIQNLIIGGAQNEVLTLTTTEGFDPSYRYVKVTFNKGSNVGVGPISITKATNEPVQCSTPIISYANPTVSISCTTSGANIYYTLDGTNPTASSTAYTAPFDIAASATVKAIAIKDGFSNSDVASYVCTYTVPFATISCDETLSIANSESDGTISVTYQYAEDYEINVYEDAEHTIMAGDNFWFTADFVDADESDYNVFWMAEANAGPERKAYIVISVMNSNTDITDKEIVVTQAKVSGGEEHTITLSCTNWINTSYNTSESTFDIGDVTFGYINAMKNGSNGTLLAGQKIK